MGRKKSKLMLQRVNEVSSESVDDMSANVTAERELEFTPELGLLMEKSLVDIFLDRMIIYATDAIDKAKENAKARDSEGNRNTVKYWTNVRAGYRWAKEINASRSK